MCVVINALATEVGRISGGEKMIIPTNIHYFYSAFSGLRLPATSTHYIPYIYSAFSGLPATYTHYIPYIYNAFSRLRLPTTYPTISPIFTALLVGCPPITQMVPHLTPYSNKTINTPFLFTQWHCICMCLDLL